MKMNGRPELPLGFGMALAQNTAAMSRFASMSPEEQTAVIERTHGINSKDEMRSFVDDLLG